MTSILLFLTRALAFSGVIDIQSPTGRKIYEATKNPLSSSNKFDAESHGLYGVLKEYLYHGNENGCPDEVSGINMIPDNVQNPNTEYKNLDTQYGKISIENVRSFEKTYIDTPIRSVQECHMMYNFIMNSI